MTKETLDRPIGCCLQDTIPDFSEEPSFYLLKEGGGGGSSSAFIRLEGVTMNMCSLTTDLADLCRFITVW